MRDQWKPWKKTSSSPDWLVKQAGRLRKKNPSGFFSKIEFSSQLILLKSLSLEKGELNLTFSSCNTLWANPLFGARVWSRAEISLANKWSSWAKKLEVSFIFRKPKNYDHNSFLSTKPRMFLTKWKPVLRSRSDAWLMDMLNHKDWVMAAAEDIDFWGSPTDVSWN